MQCGVTSYATGVKTILTIPSGQSSVTSSKVYEAGPYGIAASATVGGVAFSGAPIQQAISSADISVSFTLI